MEDHHHQFEDDDGGGLPIPPLDPHFPLFSENDQITPTDIDVDFPFNDDFDFSFNDLCFADNLLLEQPDINSDPDSDLLILSSDISQDWAVNPNLENLGENRNVDGENLVYDEPISSEESNFRGNCDSPEIASLKSNSGVSSGKSNDVDVCSSLLIVNDDDNNDNSGDHRSRLFRKMIKVEHAKINNQNNKDSTSSGSDCVSKCVTKSKRKIEDEKCDSEEIRSTKFRRSNVVVKVNDENDDVSIGGEGDGDEKRKARLIRNRESAQLSRQRKKLYVEELEDKVRAMHSTITDLNSRISYFMSENATLRQQLSSGGGVGGPGVQVPPPGMYPMAPYPWMPYPPAYMVKPQGTHVPLVPIPRLKPQQPVSAPKVKKSSEGKKEKDKDKEREKSGRKTKKVASVSLLGLLTFMFLFGGLLPIVDVRFGRIGDRFSGVKQGTVFWVDKDVGKVGHGDEKFDHRRVLQQSNNSNVGNTSEPLIASLFVPRNDKLVKIDGNLIIHSILASEKATASKIDEGSKSREETSLAIHRSYPPYPTPGPGSNNWRHPHLDRNQDGRQRALGSGSADFTPVGSDGKLQQWFREGLAGPMLSSGMCTEVFQFDVSPTPGSIVPATSVSNITSEDRLNSTRPNIPKNRRILHGHAIPLNSDQTLNHTKEHFQSHEPNDGLESNKTRSSVVVSVLVDPREVGDGDGEGVIGSKTLPRIFVVVLIDSVKYVTYSCMLPFMGSGSHLITA